MADVWHALADPWAQPFMRRALLEVCLIGVSAGALGCWVVLLRLSYAAESLAHAMFPGLAIAALTGIPLILGGAAGVIVAALAIALAARAPAVGGDTAVAVVVTSLFGLGVLLALSAASPPGLAALLFGDVLGVTDGDLALAGALALAVVAGLWLLHWRLLAVGLDPGAARPLGVSPATTQSALLVLLALAILVAVQGLGNLLVVAALIAPAATARTLTRRAAPMLAIAVGLAIAAGVAGLYLSYYVEVAAGASVAGAMVVLWAAAVATRRPGRGSRPAWRVPPRPRRAPAPTP
jgi:ABC-type Mn2+/Zn2+ transport system permease subunit